MANPILIEATRGPLVESWHRGAIAIAAPSGALVLQLGDVDRPVYPRSAVKALQALPLLETGAADRFGFTPAEIALACGSHAGTEKQAGLAAAMLVRAGLSPDDLHCGAHAPLGAAAAAALIAEGVRADPAPQQLLGQARGHAGDGGAHAGADGRLLGRRPSRAAAHPPRARRNFGRRTGRGRAGRRRLLGAQLGHAALGARTHVRPAGRPARGWRLQRRQALERILAACWENPELVAGRGRADTVVMRALPRQVFMKTGAEGVYCGAFPELGLGFALKIDDGTKRAAAGTAMALVERLYPAARGLMPHGPIKTWWGVEVGAIRSSQSLLDALASLKV